MDQALFEQRKQTYTAALAAGQELSEPAVFYSTASPGLAFPVTRGVMVTDAGGNKYRNGEKEALFMPIGAGVKQADGFIKHYGILSTVDPETALCCLNRCQDPKKADVVMSEEYEVLVTPPEELVRQANLRVMHSSNELEAFLEKTKSLEEENRQLREQLSAMAAAPAGKGK